MEDVLHYVWKYRLFDKLETTKGESIEVLDLGLPNQNAGPDFFNAKLKIGEQLWVGNVEIHTLASDWNKHRHHQDSGYDSVVLHIVKISDLNVFNSQGREIPQCVLSYPLQIESNINFLLRADLDLPCVNSLSSVSSFILNSWKNTLLVERLERKTNDIENYLSLNAHSWEDALYILFCRSFGFGINTDSFERLARSTPLNVIKKHADSMFQIEALLFGQAGMLTEAKDDYQQQLKLEYEFLKHKYELQPLPQALFKTMRVRPSGSPHIRIAQLASIICTYPNLFDRIVNAKDIGVLRLLLQTEPSSYWKSHYSFGSVSEQKSKYLGVSSLDSLIINVAVPMIFAYGKQIGDESFMNKSFVFLEQLKPENNSITKQFQRGGVIMNSAYDSQAFIQLKREYCEKKKCLFCRVGHSILTNK